MRLLFVLFFVFTSEAVRVEEGSFLVEPKVNLSKEYHFNYVYQTIRKHEGNYVWHPNDRGGMTYGGIARRMHPKWEGWKIIDMVKNKHRHDSIPQVEWHVKDFYLTLWVREGFENIRDRQLALNLFDFRIHSSPRTVQLFTNRVLIKMGEDPIVFGPDWVDNRFNCVDPTEFSLRLKIQRILLFNQIVTRSPDQVVFYQGWKKRVLELI